MSTSFDKFKSFIAKPISSLSAFLIGVAIGLAPIWYNNFLNEPELVGRIVTVSTSSGGVDFPGFNNVNVHTVFLSIANKRKVPVSVIDYQLILEYANGEIDTCLPFYFNNAEGVTLTFNDFTLKIPFKEQYLLNQTTKLITPEHPLSGFIQFIAESPDHPRLLSAEIILFDAFGKTYSIKNMSSEFRRVELLQFLIKDLELLPPEK